MKRLAHRQVSRHKRRSAFTLLEVMLVLVIIAAIAGIAVVNIGGFQTRAYKDIAKNQVSVLKTSLESYRLAVGSYPSNLEALYEQPSDLADPSKWMRVLQDPLKPDPWGHPYEYSLNGAEYELKSLGPDGQSGTEDDITA